MSVDLDERIRRVLSDEAERAPTPRERWIASKRHARSSSSGGTRRWAMAAAALVVAVGVGALVAEVRGRSPATGVDVGPVWVPPGEEFPLVDLGPLSTIRSGEVALRSSTRRVGVVDHPDIESYVSVGYVGGASAEEWRCVEIAGGGRGCAPLPTVGPTISVSSSVDSGIAGFDLWIWDDVPGAAAFVVYDNGEATRWQRPVAGVAAFPFDDRTDPTVIAYDSAGDQVADAGERPSPREPDELPMNAQVTPAQISTARRIVDAASTQCLDQAGAVFVHETVAELSREDADEVWSRCVDAAADAVEVWLEENDVELLPPLDEDAVFDVRPDDS